MNKKVDENEELENLIKSFNFEERLKSVNLTEKEIQTVRLAIQFSRDAWNINEPLPLETRKQISKNFLNIADANVIAAAGRREKPKKPINFFFSLLHRL